VVGTGRDDWAAPSGCSGERLLPISNDGNISGRGKRFISRLPGRYHYLPKEPRIASWPSRQPLSTLNILLVLLAVLLRGLRIARILKCEKCSAAAAATGDLINIPATYFASRLLRIPFYAYLFDDYIYQWPDDRRSKARFFESIVARRMAKVIVPNEFLEQEIKKRYSGEICVIHNPCERIDSSGNHRRAMTTLGEIKIVYTGAVYHINYEAFRLLLAAIDKTEFFLTLHIYTADTCESLAREHIFGSRVVYHDHVPGEQILDVLKLCDIAFIPFTFSSSVSEVIKTSAPGKLGDYLASGIPILANVPPDSFVSWYLKKWHCGLVVEVDDAAAVARAITRLVHDTELQADLSRHALERARIDFDPKKASQKLLSVLGISG